jgi:hypothetical protein
MHRLLVLAACAAAVLGPARSSAAQGLDLTVFAGRAFPIYDERLVLRAGAPSIPGVEVTTQGTPELRAAGGAVYGAALAFELGIFGIEGRLDSTGVGLDFTGARYDLRGIEPPFDGLTASLIADAGRFDADRVHLLSLNARLRTPGPLGLVASGGVSYLPDIRVTGTLPLAVQAPALPIVPGLDASADAARHARAGGAPLRPQRRARRPCRRPDRPRRRGAGFLLPRVRTAVSDSPPRFRLRRGYGETSPKRLRREGGPFAGLIRWRSFASRFVR